MTDRWLVVSVHDVAPATFAESRRWVAALDDLGVAATLLVIPGPWRGAAMEGDVAFAAWLAACAERGHEVAQHGWTHVAPEAEWRARRVVGSIAGRGCEEFWGLDRDEAARRIRLGLDVLHRAGFEPRGFTPPGWLAAPAARDAMCAAGFRYTTSHSAVIDLVRGSRHHAVALSHRPGGSLERVGAHTMTVGARGLARVGWDVRIALHPDDLGRPRLRDAAFAAIGHAIAGGCRPRTYLDVVESVPVLA